MAQHAAKEWLRRRRNAAERSATLAELAATELNSPLKRGKFENLLEGIGYRAGEQLVPLLAAEFRSLPPNESAAAIDAAVDALQAADLSDDAIFAANADPELLARDIRRQLPTMTDQAGLSEGAVALYNRVVDQACRHLIQVVVQLAPFQGRALTEILDRLTTLTDQLTDLFAHTPRTSLEPQPGTVRDEDFRSEYLRHLTKVLDRLDLLGLGARHRHRLPLSVAYLSLTVSELGSRRSNENWFDHAGEERSSTVRVENALGTSRRTLIVGGAGSGKTTLLDWLAVTAARGKLTQSLRGWNRCVPFPIRLRRYVDADLPRPEELLNHVASWLVGTMPDGWVHRRLRSSAALVLVDGVDEVPVAKRDQVREWLREMVDAYPEVRVVVTAREGAAERTWLAAEGFTSMTLRPMTPADIRLFTTRWHDAAAEAEWLPCEAGELPAVQRRLTSQLDARPDLRELASIPLLCAMLCALNLVRGTNLPHNRMELYRAALAMLVELRDAEKNVPTLLNETEKMVLLRDIAWRLTLAGDTELPKADVLRYVELKLRSMPSVTLDKDAVLDHLLVRTGVLREPVPDRVDFVHRTFLEYLAASEATEGEHIATLVGHAHLDTWRQTIIMACGHAKRSQVNDLLARILALIDKGDRQKHLRLLAASCLETITDLDPYLRTRINWMISEHLVPPRDDVDVEELAVLGHLVLRYLPSSLDGLDVDTAVATIRVAMLTYHIDALQLLADYARQADKPMIQQALIEAWRYFEPEQYAEQVVSQIRFHYGKLELSNEGLLPAARRLTNVSRLTVVFARDHIDDFGIFQGLEHLKDLATFCRGTVDLSPLAEHAELARVRLHGAEHYLNVEAMSACALQQLILECRDLGKSLHRFRDLSTLASLELSGLSKVTDVSPLGMLQQLESLTLRDCQRLHTIKPIGTLPELRHLTLNGCEMPDLAAEISVAFPGLRTLELDEVITDGDMTPLAELSELREVCVSGMRRPYGLSVLGDRVRIVGGIRRDRRWPRQ